MTFKSGRLARLHNLSETNPFRNCAAHSAETALLHRLTIPKRNDHAAVIGIETLYAQPGARLAIGGKLGDFSMELTTVSRQNAAHPVLPQRVARIALAARLGHHT